MRTAIALAEWLLDRENVTAATPVTVQIGRRTYSAARYTETNRGVEGTRLYILGTMPPLHDKMRRICYRTDDSGYDWHLIAWFRRRAACTEWGEVHPFGSHFILAEWSPVQNWAADQCGRRAYRRISMTIIELGPTLSKINERSEEKNK